MPKQIHKLSDVDLVNKFATCAHCGPVRLKVSGKTRRCMTAIKEDKQKPSYKKYMATYMTRTKRGGHGLTGDEARELKESRECWICGESDVNKLHVDHCHETEVIRGILCMKHNVALGMFEDNEEHLTRAIQYLKTAPHI